ncbi:hypothetical protein GW932_00355 [archaeon]|nr:hypothetical protein [archaeon]
MELELDKYYFLEIKRRGRFIDYKAKIRKFLKNEVSVLTDDGERLTFFLNEIVRYKEIPPFEKKREFIINTKRVPKEKLKPVLKPEF